MVWWLMKQFAGFASAARSAAAWISTLLRFICIVFSKSEHINDTITIDWTKMTSTGRLNLRLLAKGEPLDRKNANDVLILPSVPAPATGPLFEVTFTIPAGSEVTTNGIFHTNVPEAENEDFVRTKFRGVSLGDPLLVEDVKIPVSIWKPGAYCWYITYDGDKKTESYYFNVPPSLFLDGNYVPFNDLNVQTVVSKWTGGLDQWPRVFGYVHDKGYNMVHYTPLQTRGELDSPYSIYDQLEYDPKLFSSEDVAHKAIADVKKNHQLLGLSDVVLNHTANNSKWLRDHPDAGYNAETAPHLKSAIALERAILDFDIESLGLPLLIKNNEDISTVLDGLDKVIDGIDLWQFYVFDVKAAQEAVFKAKAVSVDGAGPELRNNAAGIAQVALEQTSVAGHPVLLDRFENKFDPSKLRGLVEQVFLPQNDQELEVATGKVVDNVNVKLYQEYNKDRAEIRRQFGDRLRYLRLDSNGPQLGPISAKHPVIETYFTRVDDKNGNTHWLANNGWVWGGNPLVDFALDKTKTYLTRELIVWGDCVKLRYGSGPEDSPHLWKRMIGYVEELARVFDGFRIDNCHLTPIHVGEILLDAARRVNPHLYVVAELFSGSEAMDKIFVERLGLNTLIREAMQANDVKELSLLVHKHGGRPIGLLAWLPLDDFTYPVDLDQQTLSLYSQVGISQPVVSAGPHALFMDCTHDNETPTQKRTTEDALPTAALVAFCSLAIGLTLGFDELYPKLLDVVGEARHYGLFGNGIASVKSKLHAIRRQLVLESDSAAQHEMYIHHEGQYITIQRHNAKTGKGWFLIARTKFSNNVQAQTLSACKLGGAKVKYEFGHVLKVTAAAPESDTEILGIPAKLVDITPPTVNETSEGSEIITNNSDFPAGSIAVFSVSVEGISLDLDDYIKTGALDAADLLSLSELNEVLYKCDAEERVVLNEGVYNIPGWGPLIYAGLEGWNLAMRQVVWDNNLGLAFCDHIRSGTWALDYVVNRLDNFKSPGVAKFQKWLRQRMDKVRTVPYFLRPRYFCLVVGIAYEVCRQRALHIMAHQKGQTGTNFIQRLAMTSVQMVGVTPGTAVGDVKNAPSLAAGLPHFSTGFMRCWGRDVFIALPGLLLATGRFEEAKEHILGFAATVNHGLIPNLLDGRNNPRYNARDATWFFLEAVQQYVGTQGPSILGELVKRRFPKDEEYVSVDDPKAFSESLTLGEIIYEILATHAGGIHFREHNAGEQIDSQMKSNGFNIDISVDWSLGLIFGGNQDNCGTWMDKMGELQRAGSKGVPGTPRDGAAVEISGLLKLALRFVNQLREKGEFAWDSVTTQDGEKVSLAKWELLVQESFERSYYVPENAADDQHHDVNPKVVNRRGVYKDVYKSGKEFEDYQLRCNVAIAMLVAPELFDPDHAKSHVNIADKVLRDHIGVATLDPSDWAYVPYYDNLEDLENFATAKGRLYHQGPPWSFPLGYHLQAFHKFVLQDAVEINKRLQYLREWIADSNWAGITELTNAHGKENKDLSPSQAWSTGTLLEFIAASKK